MTKSILSREYKVGNEMKTFLKRLVFYSHFLGMGSRSRGRKFFIKSGQGMVEFALTVPVIILLIFGIFEVAHLMYVYNTVVVAAREASRYGAGAGGGGSAAVQWQDCAGIKGTAIRAGNILGIQKSDIIIQYDRGPGVDIDNLPITDCVGDLAVHPMTFENYLSTNILPVNGIRVLVTVSVNYSPLVPIPYFPELRLTSTSRHTVLANIPIVK